MAILGPVPVRLCVWLLLLAVSLQSSQVFCMEDVHGGVPMGQLNFCDNAKTNIEIDWDPTSTEEHTCHDDIITPSQILMNISCEEHTKRPVHVCYPEKITYEEDVPTSGRHRPDWPDYGEYRYVPPQRWLHNLEHGAVVMLYHPCADPAQVKVLKNIVRHCLRRHIITPYKLLSEQTPFALLTWGCKLTMSKVDPHKAVDFIKDHAIHDAPESTVSRAGQYTAGRIVEAAAVSDFDDTVICPLNLKTFLEESLSESENAGDTLRTVEEESKASTGPGAYSVDPFLFRSQRRNQQLNVETDKLDRKIRRLMQAYRRLVSV